MLAALAVCASLSPVARPKIVTIMPDGAVVAMRLPDLLAKVCADDQVRMRKCKAPFAVVSADAIGLGDANGLSEVFARVNC